LTADTRNTWVCAGAVFAAGMVTVPVLEMGVIDDWSFAYTAGELARTGEIRYYGWAAMPLLPQAWLGALVIRLCGFSFTALRLFTMLVGAACGAVLYGIGRRSGLQPTFALFASLLIVLSPLFIPLAASFMTDVPGLFFELICLYSAVRALNSAGVRRCQAWTLFAALAGALGGMNRQFLWGLALWSVPLIAWRKRTHRGMAAIGLALGTAVAAACWLNLRWFAAQPYIVATTSFFQLPPWTALSSCARTPILLALDALLLLLPALALYRTVLTPRLGARARLAGLTVFSALLALTFGPLEARAPYLGNIVTAWGILAINQDAIGQKPMLLAPVVRSLLSLIVLAAAGACAAALVETFNRWKTLWTTPEPPAPNPRPLLSLLLPFSAGYLVLLIRGGCEEQVFDRYLLPVLPGLVIPLLWHYQEAVRDRIPVIGWVVLLAFGSYGVATTHDFLAAARARLAAASSIRAAGIPRRHITAGIEYDGWTQIQEQGYVNNAYIRMPPDAYRVIQRPHPVEFWFWSRVPALEPRYFVVYSRQPGLLDTPFPPVRFTTWLPPRRREVLTQMAPSP
jgi:hypothetical protein